MASMDPNAILRGAQLTLVGAYRALQNPQLFNFTHYRQAFMAIAVGLAIQLVLSAPIIGVRMLLRFVGLFTDLQSQEWDDSILSGLRFLEHSVLQLPFFLMSAMRYITPSMDEMFMKSLDWVDRTYLKKHSSDDPTKLRALYYPHLRMYHAEKKGGPYDAAIAFVIRYARRAGISLAVYLCTFIPHIGRFVLPAASFYSFNAAVGTAPACLVFGVGLFVPKRVLVVFLQGFFASRSLMRELLEPYFTRIRFTKEQKVRWFKDRQGLLFGFGVGFYFLLKVPLLSVLIYGIAEASTAYLITKITDPPPPPSDSKGFSESQVQWKNQHEFLKLDLGNLDKLNVEEK